MIPSSIAADTPTDPKQLVESLAGPDWFPAYQSLIALGTGALPAIREGLRHEHWQVRRWCAACVDHNADSETLYALIPLLDDPKAIVRLWAVHSISCERCKDCANPIDVIPLLLRRVEEDTSVRVRRMSAAMLVTLPADKRVQPVLEPLLDTVGDKKLRGHMTRAVEQHRSAASESA